MNVIIYLLYMRHFGCCWNKLVQGRDPDGCAVKPLVVLTFTLKFVIIFAASPENTVS